MNALFVGLFLAAVCIAAAFGRNVVRRFFLRSVILETREPLGTMLAQTGVGPAEAWGREHDLTVALARCADCDSKARCVNLLEQHCAQQAKESCPNCSLITELQAMRQRHAALGKER